MRIENNTAFSLMEIMLASVIFVISVAGVFATLNAVRGPVPTKENTLAAVLYAKQLLEALRSKVSTADNYYLCSTGSVGTVSSPCPDFGLSVGTHTVSAATLSANGVPVPSSGSNPLTTCNSSITFTVSCADGSGPSGYGHCGSNTDLAHQVSLTVKWLNTQTGLCT